MQKQASHVMQVLSSAKTSKHLEIKYYIDSKEDVKQRYKREGDRRWVLKSKAAVKKNP